MSNEFKAPASSGSIGQPPARIHGRAATGLRKGLRLTLLLGAASLALAACEPGAAPMSTNAPAGAAAKPQKSTRIVDRDVEAPQAFQVTDTALWDGRPSLGGVWVASPDVKDPERVIMRNPANGKFVIGALFRRERDNPGPNLQISSDAAEALGMLAGAPAKISVTALRREEAPEATPKTPILDTNESLAGGGTAPAGVTAGAIDAGGVETKPLDPPGTKPAAGKPPAKTPAKAAPNAPPKAPAKTPAETAAMAGAALATAPAAPAAKPAPAAPAASGAGRPIQIGFFSVEANAQRAKDQLAKAGIPSEIRKESAKGKDYWSVFARGDAAALKKVKAAGFADAYMLK